MMLSTRTVGKPCISGRPSAMPNAQTASRKVHCSASATAWDSWNTYMDKRSDVIKPGPEEKKVYKAIGEAIKGCATSYRPHYSANASMYGNEPVYKKVKNVNPLSADLHEKLEAVGLEQLKAALGHQGDTLEAAGTSFTTSDINAGICITGAIVQKGDNKEAVMAFVATETERQASWSRLEGLLLHWACASEPGAGWSMPPAGWKALLPNKTADAGGAMQCAFEKQTRGQQTLYVLVLSVPLSGVLRTGGITFVLKASDAQNTKWLKDASTQKDFFVDIHNLPFAKV